MRRATRINTLPAYVPPLAEWWWEGCRGSWLRRAVRRTPTPHRPQTGRRPSAPPAGASSRPVQLRRLTPSLQYPPRRGREARLDIRTTACIWQPADPRHDTNCRMLIAIISPFLNLSAMLRCRLGAFRPLPSSGWDLSCAAFGSPFAALSCTTRSGRLSHNDHEGSRDRGDTSGDEGRLPRQLLVGLIDPIGYQ